MSSYKLETIEGVGPENAQRLLAAGVKTTGQLLDACATPKGRAAMAVATGFSEDQLLKWTNLADLLRVKGVGEEYSELLEAAGVETVRELKARRPDSLAARMLEVNAKKNLVRQAPAESMVARWIAHSKNLSGRVTY